MVAKWLSRAVCSSVPLRSWASRRKALVELQQRLDEDFPAASRQITRFLEIYVECPLEVCMARDPKGIYEQAREGVAENVPGLQAAYEPPIAPEVGVRGNSDSPEASAARITANFYITAKLTEKGYL